MTLPAHLQDELSRDRGHLRIDATKKLPGEACKHPWPLLITLDESVKAKVEKLFGGSA